MYLLCGFHIVEIAGDGEFASIADQVASLPTNPVMDLAAASQHVGLIERNIRFLKEKTRSIRHSLPFECIDADELPGVDAPDVAAIPEPTGVDMDGFEDEPSQEETVFDSAAFDTAVDGGLKEQVAETNMAASPKVGMAARNARIRNPPKQYVPNMKGNKYQVALAQITTSLGMSDRSMAFAKMSVKLMSKGIH